MAMKRKNLPAVVPKLFEHEQFGQIRFVRLEPRFEPWFVAVDVCKVLDIQNIRQNLADFPNDEKMTVILNDAHSKNGVTNSVCNTYGSSGAKKGWIENRVTVVSEPGLYRLIFMSRKPEAEKFKRWVFHEELPSIRKYGYYVAPNQKLLSISGSQNFKKFQAQYPAGTVEVKAIYLDADENEYGELGQSYFRYEFVLHSKD